MLPPDPDSEVEAPPGEEVSLAVGVAAMPEEFNFSKGRPTENSMRIFRLLAQLHQVM